MKAYGLTDVGVTRTINQDYIYYSTEPVGNLPNLFIVADGMGGHKAGDVASRTTVERFVEYVENTSENKIIAIMDEGIKIANYELVRKAAGNEDYYGMGTTLVMTVILKNKIYVANIGDSRIYLIDDAIRQISRDHSLVEEMVSLGELEKSEARKHEKKNIITRAIGGADKVVPDFFEIEYKPGDKFLLCSDGLSNMVDDLSMKRIVTNNKLVEDATKALIEEANKNGGKDNISVVLIQTQYER